MVQYILGQVSPEERAGFEERYQMDSDLFEELIATENDLIDSYARGELSGAQRVQFESRFLATPQLRERVKLAKSLARNISGPAASQATPSEWRFIGPLSQASPVARWAFTGALLGLLFWGVWMTASNIRMRNELEAMARERDRVAHRQRDLEDQLTELNARLKELQANPTAQEFARLGETGKTMVSLVLAPGLPRSTEHPHVLPISSGVSSALLLLKTRPGAFLTYNISLETPEGKQLLKREDLKPWPTGDEEMIPLSLPSATLQRGDYIVRLIGHAAGKSEEVNVYSFRVVVQ